MENRAGRKMPLKLNLKVLLCLFFSVHVVTSFSLSNGISHDNNGVRAEGMKNFTLTLGDEINRIELNILSNETQYWFLMADKVHFCNRIHDSNDSSEEDDNDEKKPKCTVKLSFSLLKMKCIEPEEGKKFTNYLKIERFSKNNHETVPKSLNLCKNDEYIYHESDSDKHVIAYVEALETVILTPVGDWNGDSTHAKILVSLHYEIINQKCPTNYFDCNAKCKKDPSRCKQFNSRNLNSNSSMTSDPATSLDDKDQLKSVCIPNAWLCDKYPNCGAFYDADEAQDLCFWDENGDESTSGLRKLENFLIAMVDVIFYGLIPLFIICLLFKMVFRKYITRRNITPASGSSTGRNTSPDLEVAQSPSAFGSYFNSRRKSEEPPTYDEVVQNATTNSIEQSTTENDNENLPRT